MVRKTYTEEDVKALLEKAKTQYEAKLSSKEASLAARESLVIEKEARISNAEKKLAEATLLEASAKAKEEACTKMMQQITEQASKKAEEVNNYMMNAERAAGELREKRMASVEAEVQKILDAASKQADSIRNSAQNEYNKIIEQAQSRSNDLTSGLQKQISELQNKIVDLSESNAKLISSNTHLTATNQTLEETLKETQEHQRDDYNTFQKNIQQYKSLQNELEANGKDIRTISQEIAKLEERDDILKEKEAEYQRRYKALQIRETFANNEESRLQGIQNDLDNIVENRYGELLKNKDEELRSVQAANAELRSELSKKSSISAQLDLFKESFDGKNFAEVFADYKRVQEELALVNEKLMNTPSLVLIKKQKDLEELEEELNRREERLADLKTQAIKDNESRIQAEVEKNRMESELQQANEIIKSQAENLQRYRSTYEDPSSRNERIKVINTPYVKDEIDRNKKLEIDELKWLNEVNQKINEYGLHFPKRILYAFHTALKTAEMSPLTVLAGVSGTGKSELPRLYSLFGGINFLGVPVQPNWDCQESMLGYYNSIDNCFEATDILKLLAQSQRDPDDENGLNDAMTMILLDEMNLANVELYFAEFLSKLETRRGRAEEDVPHIGVKIGSKMEDWPLRLGRNVLWIGTMNNDETTKTLSDKVIDRGIIINFPRPKKLIRSKGGILPGTTPLISRSLWNSWVEGAYNFSEEEIKPYLETVENINIHLGKTGRALGHRVWQSIESYMSLYPTVIKAQSKKDRQNAMDDAFEDQLVQKVMPKLRGIETRGSQGEALDAIENLIPETLREDFKNAKQGYGQFIWSSSTYLQKDDSDDTN